MLRDDIARYTELSGEDGEHTSIQKIGAYLDGYDKGYEQGKKDYGRPQGHYIKGENGEWYCSNCKRIDDKYSVANFCWHCGADMRGDKR